MLFKCAGHCHISYSLRHFLLLISSYATFKAVSMILWNRSCLPDEEEEIESTPASSPCCDDDGDNDDCDGAYGKPSLIAVSACMAWRRRRSKGVPWGVRRGVLIRLGLKRLDLLPPLLSAKKSILYICYYCVEVFLRWILNPLSKMLPNSKVLGQRWRLNLFCE